MTITYNQNVFALLMACVSMLGIFIYVGMLKIRAHRLDQVKERIVRVVAAYFASTSVAVRSVAIALPAVDHFIIIADTEPLKRFRYSHIIELVLIDKIKQETGKTVDSVYWRFPLPVHEEEAVKVTENITIPPSREPMVDAYLAHGLELLRAPEGLEVNEDSWEHFQEVVHEREEARIDESVDPQLRQGSA